MKKILILPGDGIGKEVTDAALRVIETINQYDHQIETETSLIGGASIDQHMVPLTPETLKLAKQSDGVLLGAVGGPQWDKMKKGRPEQGLIELRAELGLFANLRPAISYPHLSQHSTIKPEHLKNTDILFVRELIGGLYYGEPRGVMTDDKAGRYGVNTATYTEAEIIRIAISAFEFARKRDKFLVSVDKANVLEVGRLWRDVVNTVSSSYSDVKVEHFYVDNMAMQLVMRPTYFDVVLCPNMFGDILSDLAAAIVGSIGLLPSGAIGDKSPGLYEPIHGSAPDIAGKNCANPIATILSLAMMLRYSLELPLIAEHIESAVLTAINNDELTADLNPNSPLSTLEATSAIINHLNSRMKK